MKIALISTNVLPSTPWTEGFEGYGGLEPVVGEIAKGLAERKHEITLFAAAGTVISNCEVVAFEKGASEEDCLESYESRLSDFDIVQDHSWSHWPVVHFHEHRRMKTKLQLFHHGVLGGISMKPPIAVSWTAFSHAQAVMVGERLGIPVRYVHHGIPSDLYSISEEEREDYYLILSRLSPEKGVIPAVEMLRDHGKRVVVIADDILIADPEYVAKFKRLVDGKQVQFVPGRTIKHAEKVRWLQRAKALVHTPSYPWIEIFGLAAVEAMACGTPVLAFRNGALEETIEHGKSGYLADTLLALAEYLDQTDAISAQACRIRAEHFSLDAMIDGHEVLLNDILAGRTW